jgi:hypothetical protein
MEGARALRLWAGVAIPPLAALAGVGLTPALVEAACAGGPTALLHAAVAALLLVSLGGVVLSWRSRERGGAVGGLLGAVGLSVGALSLLVLLGMWAAVTAFDPCLRY